MNAQARRTLLQALHGITKVTMDIAKEVETTESDLEELRLTLLEVQNLAGKMVEVVANSQAAAAVLADFEKRRIALEARAAEVRVLEKEYTGPRAKTLSSSKRSS